MNWRTPIQLPKHLFLTGTLLMASLLMLRMLHTGGSSEILRGDDVAASFEESSLLEEPARRSLFPTRPSEVLPLEPSEPSSPSVPPGAAAAPISPFSPIPLSPPPSPDIQKQISDLVLFYTNTSTPEGRSALAWELAAIDSPAAVEELLRLHAREEDSQARKNLLYALGTAAARDLAAPQISQALQSAFHGSSDSEERGLIEEVLADAPTADTVQFFRELTTRADLDPYERLTAQESLMRISAYAPTLVSESEIQALQENLRAEAQASGGDPDYQSLALMALGGRKEENTTFFQQMQESVQDPNVRTLLTKLLQ